MYGYPYIYIHELVVEEAWGGKGIGSWAVPKLFQSDKVESPFFFVWPAVLNHLARRNPMTNPTEEEIRAFEDKRERVIRFYRKVRVSFLLNFYLCRSCG